MLSNITKFFLSVILIFTLGSCNKSDLYRPIGQTSLQYAEGSLMNLQQYVVFLFGEINEDEMIEKGWIIATDGTVRNFELDSRHIDPAELSCSFNDLIEVGIALEDEIGSVDLDELTKHFNKIEIAARLDAVLTNNEDAENAYAYLAFAPNNEYETSNGNCNVPYFSQVTIFKEGKAQLTNPSDAAKEILIWLESVQEDLYQ